MTSVIIGSLRDLIPQDTIQAKVYKLKKNGQIDTLPSGCPMSVYATPDHYATDIRQFPVEKFCTPLEVYRELNDHQKRAVDEVKKFLNSAPCAAFWHNGDDDQNCQYNGLHMHILVYTPGRLTDYNPYRKLVDCLMKRFGMLVKCQKVKMPLNIMKHMQTAPRLLLGSNNMLVLGKLVKATSAASFLPVDDMYEIDDTPEEPEQPSMSSFFREKLGSEETHLAKPAPKIVPVTEMDIRARIAQIADDDTGMLEPIEPTAIMKVRENQASRYVDVWIEFSEMFDSSDETDILTAIEKKQDNELKMKFRSVLLSTNFQGIKAQALREIAVRKQLSGKTYIDRMMDQTPCPNTLDITTTSATFLDWTKEHNLNPGKFLTDLYCILDSTFPKTNCFMLQGVSNAGKTYWMSPLFQQAHLKGQTMVSQDFKFMNCLNKEIIEIPELTLSKMDEVEELKKVFEGLPTQVNVKNKPPQLLERTPVILTTNSVPWKYFSEEKAPLQNRMFGYALYQPSLVLKKVDKPADPRFYSQVFSFIREEVSSRPVWPFAPESPEMKTLHAKVEAFVRSLCSNEQIQYIRGIEEGTLLSRSNPVRDIMFRNKPSSERWRHGLQTMMMVLKDAQTPEFEKLHHVNGYLMCQFRHSDKVQDYFWSFDNEKPKLMSVEDGGQECVAQNYRKGDNHYEALLDMDYAFQQVLEQLVKMGWKNKDDYRKTAYDIVQDMCDVVSVMVTDIDQVFYGSIVHSPISTPQKPVRVEKAAKAPKKTVLQRVRQALRLKKKAHRGIKYEETSVPDVAPSASSTTVNAEDQMVPISKRARDTLDEEPYNSPPRKRRTPSPKASGAAHSPSLLYHTCEGPWSGESTADTSVCSTHGLMGSTKRMNIEELTDWTDSKLERYIEQATSGNQEAAFELEEEMGVTLMDVINEQRRREEIARFDLEADLLSNEFDDDMNEEQAVPKASTLTATRLVAVNAYGSPVAEDLEACEVSIIEDQSTPDPRRPTCLWAEKKHQIIAYTVVILTLIVYVIMFINVFALIYC